MSEPKIGVVMFDAATDAFSVIRAIELAGGQPVKLHPKTTVAPDLAELSLVILPGGFSYGDYLRPGALAATQPIMRLIEDALEAKELTVIGLGNGFQVLTEAGLLPGGFVANTTPGFQHEEMDYIVTDNSTAMTNAYDLGEQIRLIRKGAYLQYTASEDQLQALAANDNIVIRAKDGTPGADIAGVSSDDGLVLGLIASPEYAIEEGFGTDHPDGPGLGVDGQGFFISVVRAAGAVNSEGVVGA
jgi:phosphoribosylformylglycinamidine synthase